jgi:hypothetical protein
MLTSAYDGRHNHHTGDHVENRTFLCKAVYSRRDVCFEMFITTNRPVTVYVSLLIYLKRVIVVFRDIRTRYEESLRFFDGTSRFVGHSEDGRNAVEHVFLGLLLLCSASSS